LASELTIFKEEWIGVFQCYNSCLTVLSQLDGYRTMNPKISIKKMWYGITEEYQTLEMLARPETRARVHWSKILSLLDRFCIRLEEAITGRSDACLWLIKEDSVPRRYHKSIIDPRNTRPVQFTLDGVWDLLQEAGITPKEIWAHLDEWECANKKGYVKRREYHRLSFRNLFKK
jgi:hypothetical protein